MAGPNINGWTAATITPKTQDLPISEAAVARTFNIPIPGLKSFPGNTGARAEQAANFRRDDLARRKADAATAEAAAISSGDPAELQAALRKQLQVSAIESQVAGVPPLDAFKKTVNDFKGKHPDLVLTPAQERGMALTFQEPAPALSLATPGAPVAASGFTSSGGGSDLSQYDLTPSDYGFAAGPDPRAATKKQTPLEQLLATLAPQAAQPAAADPFTDPRAPAAGGGVFNNVLAALAQPQQAAMALAPVAATPAGVTGAPSYGANLAATIPGAPPFLAGAINGMQAFNPYAQPAAAPAQPQAARGIDLTGLAALSAEQRIQQAELAKNKAAAQAKWFASTAKQEQMRAEQENLNRLKGFGSSGSGWTGAAGPSMPVI